MEPVEIETKMVLLNHEAMPICFDIFIHSDNNFLLTAGILHSMLRCTAVPSEYPANQHCQVPLWCYRTSFSETVDSQ